MIAKAPSGESQERLALTYREAAEALGLCERVVWQLAKDGELKAFNVGRSRRIPVAELERFIADRTANA